jgi:glycosyltransferase involved in cell wall biosynthesis
MARRVEESLGDESCDIIFASLAGWVVALLDNHRPIISFSDATVVGTHTMGGYKGTDSLSLRSLRESAEVERELADRAAFLLVASDWARDSFATDYGIETSKLFVTPFCANLNPDEVPSAAVVHQAIDARVRSKSCNLLFVGREWHRKGGDMVVDTVEVLRARGVDARLKIIGCTPPDSIDLSHITLIEHLDKNDPEDTAVLTKALLESDFFFMPSRSEAFGIVYAEAAAFGLPAVAANVGGVGQVVQHRKNGLLLASHSRAADYAVAIAEIFDDKDLYRSLAIEARHLYETEFNWNAWGRQLAAIMAAVLPHDLASRVGSATIAVISEEALSEVGD